VFLAALPALLLPLPAYARGLDQYIRKPKPAPAVETLVATALLAQEQLQALGVPNTARLSSCTKNLHVLLLLAGKALSDTQNTDVKEFRSFLRFGPLRAFPLSAACLCSLALTAAVTGTGEFREVMRSIAKAQDASDGSILKPRVESLFRMLEDFDAGLTAWQKSEGGDAQGDARTRASAELRAATDELSSILASLPPGVVDRATALL
jgi:hypothetical protein